MRDAVEFALLTVSDRAISFLDARFQVIQRPGYAPGAALGASSARSPATRDRPCDPRSHLEQRPHDYSRRTKATLPILIDYKPVRTQPASRLREQLTGQAETPQSESRLHRVVLA